jgi:hypothetical protein
MVLSQTQYRQRQPNIIIQITGRDQGCFLTNGCNKDSRNHFFYGRLTVAARHHHERQCKLPSPRGSKIT